MDDPKNEQNQKTFNLKTQWNFTERNKFDGMIFSLAILPMRIG